MKKGTALKLCAIAANVLVVLGLTACSDVEQEAPQKIDISNESTIEGVLNEIAPYTLIDENLEDMKEEIDFYQLIDEYKEARLSNSVATCNSKLYRIGYAILKAAVAEHLNINVNDIESIKYYRDKEDFEPIDNDIFLIKVVFRKSSDIVLPGNIKKPEIKRDSTEFYVAGEAFNLIFNLNKARLGAWDIDSDPGVDEVYESFIRFLLSSGKISEEDYKNLIYIYFEPDFQKVDVYNTGR